MMQPIVLKAADVIAAARLAYDEGRLSAQGPTPECKYRDPSSRPCAIGAAVADSEAVLMGAGDDDGSSGIDDLVRADLVDTDDVDALIALQRAHDVWTGDRAVSLENDFRKLIGLGPKSEAAQ